MEKFSLAKKGYDKEEVNEFLDKVINQVEGMVNDIKIKDEKISNYKTMENDYLVLKQKVAQYERMEETLKKAILMAEKTSEQIKLTAYQERDIIVNDAKKNASRIVNDALLKAEKIEDEANNLKRNVTIFKKQLKDIVETQLKLVDDIEKIEL